MIDRYSFDDWLNYGRRGKREYSCFRFYSVGLNRGMPLVILDVLKKNWLRWDICLAAYSFCRKAINRWKTSLDP